MDLGLYNASDPDELFIVELNSVVFNCRSESSSC